MDMKNKQVLAGMLVFFGALAFSQSVRAENDLKPFVGLSVGTGGMGLQGGLQLRPNLSVRVLMSRVSLDRSLEVDGIDYELNAKLKMPHILLDYHPFGNGFYLSGGLVRNGSTLDGLATLSESIEVGGYRVGPNEVGSLRGLIKYDETVPYVGLGWRSGMQKALAWQFELGVSGMSGPSISLVEEGSNFVPQANLDAEVESMQKDLESGVYPHLRIGIQYRF